MLDKIKRTNMLTSCLDNNNNLFDEIRQQRKCRHTFSSNIDGHTEDIPDYLACNYRTLYNSTHDKENLSLLEESLEHQIKDQDLKDLNNISSELLKSASRRLKPGKTDPILQITSDCFTAAPDILYTLLMICLKGFILHAHISEFLLISTLIPIIKDKLGDITSSNNYRSIAISSLVMKLYDLVILAAYEKHLGLDDLQYSYQRDVSTSMCTWMAVETISYFLRNGSEVFTCTMDMSKAFDTVRHSTLFEKLVEQGLPQIIVRYILISYKLQQANVKWNNKLSDFFSLGNGVKQGAVISAILYCVYTNGLFEELRRLNIGCSIGQNYIGIVG